MALESKEMTVQKKDKRKGDAKRAKDPSDVLVATGMCMINGERQKR